MKGIASRLGLALVVLLAAAAFTLAQKPPDEKAAEQLLTSARKAYADKRFPESANQFRDLLNRFAQSKHADAARYGLALALLEAPEPDLAAIHDSLKKLEGDAAFPERRFVLYHLGNCERGLGVRALTQANAVPMKQSELQVAAQRHFTDAEKRFAAAAEAFGKLVKAGPVEGKALPADLDWLYRSRCDQAEMLLRLGKIKEARATLAAVLADPRLAQSPARMLANYYEGVACSFEDNNLAAGRALSRLAPFTEPVIGSHARFLLARVHEKAEEDAEATAHYEGVLADYERAKVMANESLKRPDKFSPRERARLESLRRDPAPEHVSRAGFFLGVQYYAAGRFGDAQTRFTEFLKQNGKSSLAPEAQLRLGMCQVQNKQFAEAMRTLQPLAKNDPPRPSGAAAIYWLGKAQAGDAAPENGPLNKDKLKIALATLTQSSQAAAQAYDKTDADLPRIQADILLDMADAQMQAGLFKEAAQTYGVLLENSKAGVEEEALQRRVTALHLAGDLDASDKACEQFRQKFPGSPLAGAVVFRYAENAAFRLAVAEKAGQKPANLRDEALKRYQTLIDRFPDFPYANYAHYSQALIFARAGDWEKAQKSLEAIPAPDRGGEMASASYLLADIVIRTMPTKVDDALAAGRLEEQLKSATELLDGYVGSAAKDSRMPEALVKLGYCQLRAASLLAQPAQRAEAFNRAKATFDRLRNEFGKQDVGGWGLLGRGQVGMLSGDIASGEKYLHRFDTEPFASSSAAPAGALELATALRMRGRSAEALPVLGRVMQRHEPALIKSGDPHGWLPKLRLQFGLALKESGKPAEARGVFETIVKQTPDRPEAADASLRLAQCLADETRPDIEKLRGPLANPNLKPEERAKLLQTLEQPRAKLLQAATMLAERAAQYQKKEGTADICARMLYEAAWMHRYLGTLEPNAEAKTRELYQKLIAAHPDTTLALEARLELAELHVLKGENDPALKLLDELTEKEPPADMMEKVAVLRGTCLAAKGDAKGAREQVEALAKNVKSPLAPRARLVAGEAAFRAGEWDVAIKELVAFRDQDPYRQARAAAERGLWLLGQAHARKQDWGRSRDAFDQGASRFDGGPYAAVSRYGAGLAFKAEKNFEGAANAFARAAGGTSGEFAALAQLQAGLCRLEQKRYGEASGMLQEVRRHGVPELTALALVVAARAQALAKQPEPADKLLAEVEKDFGTTKVAATARAARQALKDKKDLPVPELPAALKEPVPAGFTPIMTALAAHLPERPAAEGAGINALLAIGKLEIPMRSASAPFLRLTLPDPFEHRRAVRLRPAPAETMPLTAQLPAPRVTQP
jgi:tetratricopeptide (TPR) repeat protein